ncbi:DsbA family protein [Erysipelothrix urinaevulpis]|uniref:DsbA family oxidoreductase n=1 Tax=Erysipelothrix urinaevulpis TaxID=2683717 RepID=UPI001356CEB5|nr:DsbA family protein [Erysipelothrix urinaevulpis]
MTQLKVEFFHDVICSFCFPMSYRMREVKKQVPELNIIHRSFALAPTQNDLKLMFGSLEKAKEEIMSHWEQANQNDTLHRFNIEGMKEQDFIFPYSMNGLRAAKAAGIIGGEAMYWDVFDILQTALFVDNLDIADEAVIFNLLNAYEGIDFETWKSVYQNNDTKIAVESDLQLARNYGVNSVPSLIIEGKYIVNGALPEAQLVKTFKKLIADKKAEEKPQPLPLDLGQEGEACNFEDGKWKCD